MKSRFHYLINVQLATPSPHPKRLLQQCALLQGVFHHRNTAAPHSTCQTQTVAVIGLCNSGPSTLLFGPLKQHLSGCQFCSIQWKWLFVSGGECKSLIPGITDFFKLIPTPRYQPIKWSCLRHCGGERIFLLPVMELQIVNPIG
jgi:hypothetical protein